MRKSARKPVARSWVGWREWSTLPDLGIWSIKAKVDTGALTSALHAIHVRTIAADGPPRIAFDVHPLQRRTDVTRHCVADLVDERLVTSSTGHRETRPVIRTDLGIGGQRFAVELTLTNRDTMGFRLLIGRRAMKGRLLVDPSASYLCGAADAETRARRSREP